MEGSRAWGNCGGRRRSDGVATRSLDELMPRPSMGRMVRFVRRIVRFTRRMVQLIVISGPTDRARGHEFVERKTAKGLTSKISSPKAASHRITQRSEQRRCDGGTARGANPASFTRIRSEGS